MEFIEFNPKKKEIEKLTVGNSDCVIRSIMLAMNTTKLIKNKTSEAFTTWEEAYDIACKKGREMYAMPDTFDVLNAVLNDMGYAFVEYTETVAKFAKDNPLGCYILGMPLHSSAIINGVLYDESNTGRRRLYGYWVNEKEVKQMEKMEAELERLENDHKAQQRKK